MSNVSFTNPFLLLIAIPLIFVVIYLFIRMNKEEKVRPKNIVSLVLHLVICLLLTCSIADLRVLDASSPTDLIVLADVSTSNQENLDLIDKHVNKISSKKDSSTRMGVICYGKNFELITPLGGFIRSVKSSKVDKSATDLEGALRYANSLFDNNHVKRIILISDGTETDNSSINALDDLIKNNVYIDAIYTSSSNIDNEALISEIDYQKNVFVNRENILKVSFSSSRLMKSRVKIFKDNNLFRQIDVTLKKGVSIFDFAIDNLNVGIHAYKVVLEPENDTLEENNIVYFSQEVKEDIKVLMITETTKDYTELLKLYSENTEIDAYIGDFDVPYSIFELCQYDEIVLSNINIVQLNQYEKFVQNLEIFVSRYGKSLLTFGATYATGTSSEIMSKYNSMLPVQFESSEAKALSLVIDSSSSMLDEDRLEMAKQGAIACLDLLSEKDYVSVISFSEDVRVIQPLTSSLNKEKIIEAINSIEIGYATQMGDGLKKARDQIKNTDFYNKQVILLSDGLPADQPSDLEAIVKDMNNYDIITSVINISCEEGDSLMKSLSNIGGGTYYFVKNSSDLVKIILTSVADEMANQEIIGDTPVNIRRKDDEIVSSIDSLPNIQGYNYSRIKSSANTVLSVTYVNEEGGQRELPLYSYWTYGEGKVASFTSNISSSWSNEFRKSSNGRKFLTNALEQIVPLVCTRSAFVIDVKNNGFTTNIALQVGLDQGVSFVKVKCVSPTNKVEEKYLQYNQRAYRGIFTTNEIGEYKLEISYLSSEKSVHEQQNFFFSYSDEYNVLKLTNESLLYQLTRNRGSVSTEVNYVLTNEEIDNRMQVPLTIPFLIITLLLFIIDIAIRKLRFIDMLFKKK